MKLKKTLATFLIISTLFLKGARAYDIENPTIFHRPKAATKVTAWASTPISMACPNDVVSVYFDSREIDRNFSSLLSKFR